MNGARVVNDAILTPIDLEPLAFEPYKREVLTFVYTGDPDMRDTLRACRWCDPERYPASKRPCPKWRAT